MQSLPDVRTLISLRQHLLGSDKMQVVKVDKFSPDDRLKNVGESDSLSLSLSFLITVFSFYVYLSTFFSPEVSESSSLLYLTLVVLHHYQSLSPQLFMQVDFNVAKLLPSIDVQDNKSHDPDVLRETLQILLDAPSGFLKWNQLVSEQRDSFIVSW